jgi:hypothetical protein
MGEYIRARDAAGTAHDIKIGVCEELTAIRHSEAVKIATDYAVDPSNIWRFPYPDEDAGEHDIEAIEARLFRSFPVAFPSTLDVADIEHGSYCVNVKPTLRVPGGPDGFNLFLPCPQSHGQNDTQVIDRYPDTFDWSRARTSGGRDSRFHAFILGEKYDETGHPRTVFQCAFCGYAFSLTTAEVEILKASMSAPAEREIAARLTGRAGA